MSSASVSSNKRENNIQELEQQLETIRAVNSSLHMYLDNIRTLKHSLILMHKNCKNLQKVNTKWIDTIKRNGQ